MAQEGEAEGAGLSVPEPEGRATSAAAPVVGTLDVDLLINKLLGFKNNPGKQVVWYSLAIGHITDSTASKMT